MRIDTARRDPAAGAGGRRGAARPLVALLLLPLLAACAGEDAGPGDGPTGGETQIVSRDVEAPEVFSVSDQGLWDGRPSLGGGWVAYPEVAVEQIGQVLVRNEENGRFVIGALFRREREAPGPALQVSSEAAEALGMLAGSPAPLNVVALRRDAEGAPREGGATTDFDAAAPIAEVPLAPAEAAPEAPAPAPAVSPTPAPAPAGTLTRPYVQAGFFSVEDNARDAARRLEALGLTARVEAAERQGQAFWSVTVGPAQTEADRDALLERVKAQGFPDAYPVRD